jgi:hypothetical protein
MHLLKERVSTKISESEQCLCLMFLFGLVDLYPFNSALVRAIHIILVLLLLLLLML